MLIGLGARGELALGSLGLARWMRRRLGTRGMKATKGTASAS
jgi:hypothetical protein